MDVFKIKHNTRPESVQTYSKEAREQVTRLVAALAHYESDQDDISLARVSEAQAGLKHIMVLDDALKNFQTELDKTKRGVQDSFYDLQDTLRDLTPAGHRYAVPQSKGTTHVQPYGQAKLPGPTTAAQVSAAGNATTSGAVR